MSLLDTLYRHGVLRTVDHALAQSLRRLDPATPDLVLAAAADHQLDLAASFLIGDRWRDIDCGAAAGVRTILLDRHYDERAPDSPPDHIAGSLSDAAQWILSVTNHTPL